MMTGRRRGWRKRTSRSRGLQFWFEPRGPSWQTNNSCSDCCWCKWLELEEKHHQNQQSFYLWYLLSAHPSWVICSSNLTLSYTSKIHPFSYLHLLLSCAFRPVKPMKEDPIFVKKHWRRTEVGGEEERRTGRQVKGRSGQEEDERKCCVNNLVSSTFRTSASRWNA